MYQYPNYNPTVTGSSFGNPRGNAPILSSPVTPTYTAMSGAYDGASYAPQTVGDILNQQNVATNTGFEQSDWRSKVNNWMGEKTLNLTNSINNGVDNIKDVGAKVSAGFDTMSFGDKTMAVGNVAKDLFSAYNTFKANKLAKEQFNYAKMNTDRNFAASANMTNSRLEDRQKARYARDPNAHASVSDYMNKYGVKG